MNKIEGTTEAWESRKLGCDEQYVSAVSLGRTLRGEVGNRIQLWVIRHKQTKQQWKAKSGKASWGGSGAAKNAWANSYQGYSDRLPDEVKHFYKGNSGWSTCRFDDQDVYEVVNISTEMVLSEVEVARYVKAVEVLRKLKEDFYGKGDSINCNYDFDELLEEYGVLGLLAEIDG